MKTYKKYYLMRVGITALFGILAGIAFLAAKPYAGEIFDVLLIAVGLMSAVVNIPLLFYALFHIKQWGEWVNLVLSLASVVFGILLMLIQRDEILLLLGIFSVAFPVVRICLVREHLKRLKRELPLMLFGIFMVFVSLAQVEGQVFTVCGIAAFILSGLYLIWSLILLKIRLSFLERITAPVEETAVVPVEKEE